MNRLTDQQLLRDYLDRRSEASFAELVRRHVDLVYSAALRMVCDAHLAKDVAQGTFIALAQHAAQLADRPVLSGWLHCTARNLASKMVRSEVRRRAREQEAAAMNELLAAEPNPVWEHLAPHLDDALGELSEPDRDALLLRYFENKNLREVGQILGTTDDTAQKRVSRAVERLREFLAKRGVAAGASGLAGILSAHAVQAAPVGLAAAISGATTAGAALTATLAVTKAIAMTTLQKTLVTATIAILAGAGIYQARLASTLRRQNQALEQQQAPLAGQLAQLRAENERLSNLVAQARDSQAPPQTQSSELLRLRNKATLAQADSRELARLKSRLDQSITVPDALTNAMASGMATAEKWKQKNAMARLARMKARLNLTEQQEQAISDIMLSRIQRGSQMTLDLMMGKLTPEEHQQALSGDRDGGESEIKAQFTADQLAAYPEYLREEQRAAADSSAKSDAGRIAQDFSLSQDQQEKLRSMFYEMNLSEPASTSKPQAGQTGTFADSISMMAEEQQKRLEEKLTILGQFLSADQLATYRQEQTEQMERQTSAMKMFLPKKPAEPAP